MSALSRKEKAIVVMLILTMFLPSLIQYALTQTPPGPNTLEHGEGLNFPTITATNGYYLGATELTDRLQGTWDVALTAPTLDTGQGANELYDMDQNVLTTSDVDFNSVDLSEIYWNSANRTDTLAYPEQGASYIIFEDGSTYYAKNGNNGSIDFSGSSATTVIQSALNSLTSNRNWKEKVVLKGNFTITGIIYLQNYSSMEIFGNIKQADGVNLTNIFKAAGKTEIEIINHGTIDGNKANNPTGGSIFVFDGGCSKVTIRNYGTIKNAKSNGVYYYASSRMTMNPMGVIESCDDRGFKANDIDILILVDGEVRYNKHGIDCDHVSGEPTEHSIINNIISHNNTSPSGSSQGIYIGNSQYFKLEAISYSNGNSAGGDNVILWKCNNFEIDVLVYDALYHEGLVLDGCIIGSVRVTSSGNAGYGVGLLNESGIGCDDIEITGLIANSTSHGLYGKDATYIDFKGSIINGQDTPITMAGLSDYWSLTGCIFHDNSNSPVFVGNNNKIKNNIGFITENDGSQTLSNGTTAVNVTHGCDYTPSAGDIQIHPIETLGSASFWWVEQITTTTFEINVNADPGQDIDFAWSVDRH